MIKNTKWLALPVSVLLVLSIVMAGCSTPTPTQTTAPATATAKTTSATSKPATTAPTAELSGAVTEAGSTTVQPLAEELAAAFTAKYPGVKVTIQGGGSGVGVKSATDGTVDLGAASRELTADEAASLTPWVLAKDGIAIITHPSQTVTGLTKAQVKDIFSGKITNWSQVGGADKKINIVSREEGSGTRTAFEEMVLGSGTVIVASAILQSSNGAIRTTVAGDPNAIGFLSFGYLDSTVKALPIDGVAATVANAVSGKYPIVRPLLLVTKGQPQGLAMEFINFCLGPDAQKIVSKRIYFCIPDTGYSTSKYGWGWPNQATPT